MVSRELSMDDLGLFVAILWECWNARNRFIFGSIEENVAQLSKRTVQFVMSYRQMKEQTCTTGHAHPTTWKPPTAGVLKLNFDSRQVGEHGWGGGFAVRGYDEAIVLVGVQQRPGTMAPKIGKAQACLFAL